MKQDATKRPEPSVFRKALIANGAVTDHFGEVEVETIPNFDLNRTIFKTLEGAAARFVIKSRVGKEPRWEPRAKSEIERAYERVFESRDLPKVDDKTFRFMVEECDFDVEHADGSFLDHLYFCFEYSVHHFPNHSPLVMLLHSILGTGTNTFAMTADKIPALRELLNDFEWRHIEAFPSILRLLYSDGLMKELRDNQHRLASLKSIDCYRVIDNEPITLSAEDLWIQLNYQLVHLSDFLPVANWATHVSDISFVLFRKLHELLHESGKLEAQVGYVPSRRRRSFKGEPRSLGVVLSSLIPVTLSERMANRSVRQFSQRIGHSLDYRLHW